MRIGLTTQFMDRSFALSEATYMVCVACLLFFFFSHATFKLAVCSIFVSPVQLL
jgi:hypothetical protein